MLRVAIVDDEPIIRLGVKASIRWRELTLAFAGEFSNGAEAHRALAEEPVDILITDIKMPVMDGLELTKRVRESSPFTKVILISSYNDFEFVKQGIVLGASDYILKPTMEPEELNDVIGRCAESIRRDLEISRRLDRYAGEAEQLERHKLEQEAKRLMTRERDWESLSGKFASKFPGGCFLMRAVLDRAEEIRQRYGELHVALLLDELKESFYRIHKDGVAFAGQEAELVMLAPCEEDGSALIDRLMEQLKSAAAAGLTLGYVEARETAHWQRDYERTGRVYGYRFFDGAGRAYRCDSGADPAIGGEEQSASPPMDASLQLRERIRRWPECKYDVRRVKREACDAFSELFVGQMEPALLLEYDRQFLKAETLTELIRALEAGIREGEQIKTAAEKAPSNAGVAAKAIAFIHERFAQEITLQMVADHVHVSKNYFSMLFKKQTNENFIDYLIRLRIEHAQSLLRIKGVKIYEIAERSGFNDVKYFSKLFKRIVGCTPAEYRERENGSKEGRAACDTEASSP